MIENSAGMLEIIAIARQVRDANPQRVAENLPRRAMKLIEELGEVAQAWLNVTSATNAKHKTWDDVREEIADSLIVALDIAWTPLPGETTPPAPVLLCGPSGTDTADFATLVFAATFHLASIGQCVAHAQFALVRRHCHRIVDLLVRLALLPLADQPALDRAETVTRLAAEVHRKLEKWSANRAEMTVVTDDV